ncbi:MAG: hypothetical protein ACW976_00550 [Candidatus Ranarchaeia archaeon]|jgi:hypothetical protein
MSEKTMSQTKRSVKEKILFMWLGHLVKGGKVFHAFRLEIGVPSKATPPEGYTWVGRTDETGRRIFVGKWKSNIKLVDLEARRLTRQLQIMKVPFVFFQELRASSPSPKDPHDQKEGDMFMPWVSSSAFLRFRINRSMPVE